MPLPYEKQAEHYRQEGYAVFDDVLDAAMLEMLREQCRLSVDREDARLRALGTDYAGLNHRDKRYFTIQPQRRQPALRPLLLSPLLAEVCRATLGFNAYFFTDQFFEKSPNNGMRFPWHQDSAYVVSNGGPPDHLPYLGCWFPLDASDSENDRLRVIPLSAHPQSRSILAHSPAPASDDWVVAVDESKAVMLDARPGSIIALSSRVLYSIGANVTPHPWRAYVAQYTSEVVVNLGSRHLRNDAIQVLRNGEHVTLP
jgi:ectoine hydroxylase-related dioxygenase (phytanoyl-CoA dioxygenase family)